MGEVVTVGNGMDYKELGEGDIPVYGTGGYMLSVDKALSYDKDAVGIGRNMYAKIKLSQTASK